MRYTYSQGIPCPRYFYCDLKALITEKKIVYMKKKKTEMEKQMKKLR